MALRKASICTAQRQSTLSAYEPIILARMVANRAKIARIGEQDAMNVHRLAQFVDSATQPLQDQQRDARGFRRPVIFVTLFLWVSNYAVINGRDFVSERGLTAEVALVRIGVVVLGCGLCYLIHLVIARMAGKSFRQRAIAVIIMTPFAADIFSWLNALGVWLVAPERAAAALPISTIIFSVGYHVWFFMAWAAFYLALTYSEEAREQERRAAAIQANAHAAQLRALQFQVNPHFLFNTLNSIAALIVDGHSSQAEQMVTRLAAFFRSNLSADPLEDVRLSEEIAAQRLYLEIEQVRFPDLKVKIDVPEKLQRALVPSLILQPLIENAVKHGVANNPCAAEIHLKAASEGDWLILEVSDDGLGAHGSSHCGTGIGLANVQERLLRRFGDCCTFEAGPAEPRGYLVHMKMPLRFVI
jgi:two-component system LytT family sensor kinase